MNDNKTKEDGIELKDNFVLIKDNELIKRLRSLGADIKDENRAKISYLEGAYFADENILPLDKNKLLKESSIKKPYDKYEVLKYLRDMGYITRTSFSNDYLRVHKKGHRPGRDRTRWLVKVVNEVGVEELLDSLDKASDLRKKLIIAIVDEGQDRPQFLKFNKKYFS